EFTELNEDSRRVVERELGDVLDAKQVDGDEGESPPRERPDTIPPSQAPTALGMPDRDHESNGARERPRDATKTEEHDVAGGGAQGEDEESTQRRPSSELFGGATVEHAV